MDDQDEAGIDPAIAEAMGFSSFGSKRRKHMHAEISSGSNFAVVGLPTGSDPSKGDVSQISLDAATMESQDVESGVNTRLGTTTIKAGAELPEKTFGYLSQANSSAPGEKRGSKEKEVVPDRPVRFPGQGQFFHDELNSQTIKSTNEECFEAHRSLKSSAILSTPMHELTRDDLEKLAYGVPNERGDLVYFQPNFLENPWAGL